MGPTLTCSDSGFRANWMLHSPTMPRCRTTLTAVRRSMKYSVSLRVWLGATTMDSPVWIPSGSRFSMLHTWQRGGGVSPWAGGVPTAPCAALNASLPAPTAPSPAPGTDGARQRAPGAAQALQPPPSMGGARGLAQGAQPPEWAGYPSPGPGSTGSPPAPTPPSIPAQQRPGGGLSHPVP